MKLLAAIVTGVLVYLAAWWIARRFGVLAMVGAILVIVVLL